MLKCIIARVRTRSWVQNIQSRLYREKGAKNFWGSGILRTIYYIEPKVCTHTIYFTTHTVGLKNEKNIAFIINKSRLKLMFKKRCTTTIIFAFFILLAQYATAKIYDIFYCCCLLAICFVEYFFSFQMIYEGILPMF